jgi:predicted ATPase/class 3 adenylate cyclase
VAASLTAAETPVTPVLEPATAPEAKTLPLEGERRLATIVVADITGSTDLLERIGSEAWVEIMNRVLQVLETQVYHFGGQVDQFRGDGLVAFFGAVSANEDDPERAVLAALAMHQALKPFASELADNRDIELLLRVGVNTGEVIVTSVGDIRQHREDTAMGEAIAVAARMEAAAEPGTVLVSQNTYRLVESQFEWQPLDKIQVKGFRRPIAVYRPLAPQVDPGQTYGLSVSLIGRDAEFEILKGCVDDLYASRGGMVLVTGDKGMGKSFLVTEVRQHFARHGALMAEAQERDVPPRAALTWLRGRCRSYSQSWPYSMWLSLMRNWLGMHWGEPQEDARERLRCQAEQLWGERFAEHYPYLAALLGLPLEEDLAERIRHLDAESWRQQIFFSIRSWLEAMGRREPVVLDFSDVHWADTTSLELLKYCLPLSDQEALLWLIVFRPDRTSPVWGLQHHVETEYPHRRTILTLAPLTTAQSQEFIEQLIGKDVLPREMRDLVVDKAEGNPYYMRELLNALIAQDVLVWEDDAGQWRATRAVESLDLPDSLQNLLLARIDRLSAEERHVLQLAAVMGPLFWSDVLQHIAEDQVPLREHLTALQRVGLIQERGRTADLGMEYLFTSNLVRDAAYESLLHTQRVNYHRQVAEQLEKIFGQDALSRYYGLLAYHYRQADDLGKELFYSLMAADQAKRLYANSEALERYTRALELLAEIEQGAQTEEQMHVIRTQRFEVLNGRREVLFLTGDFESSRVDAEELLSLARQLSDDSVWLIDALLQQPGVAQWQTRAELEAGFGMAEEALNLARQLGDRRREMQSLVAVAQQRLWVNDPTAWELAHQALELARQLGDRSYEIGILISMGQVYAWSDHPEQGLTYLETALEISQELEDKVAETSLIEFIGLQYERNGDYHRLLTDCHQERLRISREIGHRPVEADALMDSGQIKSLYLGDYEGGLELLHDCLHIWEGTPREAIVFLRIAQIYTTQGYHQDAGTALARARQIIEERAVREMGLAGLNLVSAIFHNAAGDPENWHKALAYAAETRRLVADAPLTRQYEMAAACEASAAYLGLASRAADGEERTVYVEKALESSGLALDIYRRFGFVQIIECVSEEILWRHGLALNANDRTSEADEFMQQAYAEMMRKYALIPTDSPFRRTYLDNIPLHRSIRAALAEGIEQA